MSVAPLEGRQPGVDLDAVAALKYQRAMRRQLPFAALLVLAACHGAAAPSPPPVAPSARTVNAAEVIAILGTATRYRVPVDGRPCRGAAEPLVTIIEFVDFHSPFVRRVEPVIDRLLLEHGSDLRVCVRHFPVARDNPSTMLAAEASEEALAQGGPAAFFLAYKHLLTEPVSPASVDATVTVAKLDAVRFRAALADHRHRAQLDEDTKLAVATGHDGAPNFFIQGRNLGGARPYLDFEQLVGEELDRARRLIDAGVARAQVFEQVMMHVTAPAPLVRGAADTGTVWVRLISVSFGGYGLSPANRTREQARAIADSLLARIRRGEDFAEVARQMGEDAVASRGGDFGPLRHGTLTDPVEQTAFALAVGAVGEVVTGEHGFTIVQRYR